MMHSNLLNAYQRYIDKHTGISNEDMACSYNTCNYLLNWCIINKPKRVIDLGSGISSYTLRLYKELYDKNITVFSVDHNNTWLDKTISFISKDNLNIDNCIFDIKNLKEDNFDLVFHDYSNMSIRGQLIERAINLAKPYGTILFDDCHKEKYYNLLISKLDALGCKYMEIPETIDNIYTKSLKNRFCIQAIKNN